MSSANSDSDHKEIIVYLKEAWKNVIFELVWWIDEVTKDLSCFLLSTWFSSED